MSHLAVKIGDNFLALKDDASIDIEDTNPLFNDTQESWSYPFEVPIEGNRSVFGNIEDIQSDNRLVSLENTSMSIIVDGVSVRNGKVATAEDQTLNDSVSISMTSNSKSLSDLYGNLTLQDLTFPSEDMDDLKIGEMIGDVCANGTSDYGVTVSMLRVTVPSIFDPDSVNYINGTGLGDGFIFSDTVNSSGADHREVQPQALGFSSTKQYECDSSYPYEAHKDSNGNLIIQQDYINTCYPFGSVFNQPDGTTRRALYCNSRISYIHHKKASDGSSSDEVQNDKTGYGPYFVLEADRQQSGICFYIMYVLEVLFKYLDLVYDSSNFSKAPDFRRLAFFTTLCKYDTKRKYTSNGDSYDFPFSSNFDDSANKWLSSRNTDGTLEIGNEDNDDDSVEKKSIRVSVYTKYEPSRHPSHPSSLDWIPVEDSAVVMDLSIDQEISITFEGDAPYHISDTVVYKVHNIKVKQGKSSYEYTANVLSMYANADNLPEMTISSFVESLWASFGLKFYLDLESNVVTPIFVRDVFRDNTSPVVINCPLYEIHKESEKITGFRMHYSNESDPDEQDSFIRKGVTDYDTAYDYQVEKSKSIKQISDYYELAHGILSVGDTTCYIDIKTGNAYRIKINKDALDEGDINGLKPSLFQVSQFHGVEIGDCSDENEDYVEEVSSEFTPLDLNDINYTAKLKTSLMCPYSDEDMWNENVTTERVIRNVIDSNLAKTYYIDEKLTTKESYDPSDTDDGNSPLQSSDWGNAIIMMRGGGSDASIEHYDYNYDGFGSWKWRTISGSYSIDFDSISVFGEQYDYNGTNEGIDDTPNAERFSLKIRAYHTDPTTGDILCNSTVAKRGLYDTFMSEYAHFLLNRKKVTITCAARVVDIQHIEWYRRYTIGGYTGWINKVTTHITAQNGIEYATIEMFIL